METTSMEALFHEKLILYRELAETVKEEKEWIVHADVDALWRVSEKKRTIADAIEDLRTKILSELTRKGISHEMSASTFQTSRVISLLTDDLKKRLASVQFSLVTLKEEIESISRDNRQYIESYLAMLDDLTAILTGRDQSPPAYSNGRNRVAAYGPRILHQEV